MWSAILAFIAKIKVKNELKKEEYKNNLNNKLSKAKDTKEIKKLKRKLKWLNVTLITTIIVPIITTILSIILICYFIMTYSSIFGFNILNANDEGMNAEEEENNWTWSEQGPDSDSSLEDFTTGGVYPKDPQLKQLAIFLEITQKSCDLVNAEAGKKQVVPSSVISILIRETGGRIINKIVDDTSLNMYGNLIYENPACGKGSSCSWIKNGTSHFEDGTVSGGKDNGDPRTQRPNRSGDLYKAYGGDHALSYAQLEITSIDGELVKVFPTGDFENKVYNDKIDRWTMDSKLKFIRPNVAYTPDVIYSVSNHLGNNHTGGSNSGMTKTWKEMQTESWFMSLSEEEKAYCYSCLKELTYVGGYGVDYDNMQVLKYTLKMCYGLKQDGKISRIQELMEFASKQYPSVVGSSLTNMYKNHKISRCGNAVFTNVVNKIMSDSSLGSNTTAASKELSSALSKASNGQDNGAFKQYTQANGYKWRQAIPMAVGFESASDFIYKQMMAEIEAADKESGGGLLPGGIAGTNYNEYIGSGRFGNPSGSEYYCPELQAVWFAQGLSGGTAKFGTILPSYTSTIQAKRYMEKTYKDWGCPAYSLAMLLSNMTGEIIMPDALPGTTTAGAGWSKGSHSVASSGLGFTTGPDNVIASLNKTLQSRGASYQLNVKKLSKQQLASSESHLYEWLDRGAMLWIRVVSTTNPLKGGNHFVTIAGYDKNRKVGNNYDLRILNSVTGNNSYTLINAGSGQIVTAEKLNQNGLAYHLRNYDTYCCLVVWRSDIADSLPGL